MTAHRVVVITGAAGGVGRELVQRFLANGDHVIATDLTENGLATLGSGDTLSTIAADLSTEDGVTAVADFARSSAGRVDVLVNCAGWFPILPFEELSIADWRRVVDVNLTGYFLVTKAILPLMKDLGTGRIINFGSGSVFAGVPDQTHYVAAKAGIAGFTRSLARSVGKYGITVNLVTPGITVTDAVRTSFPPEVLAGARQRRAIQRDEVAADLVGPVFFLASDDAAFITGQTLNVDGGTHLL
ncbi:SDR family NAD(P)-dependent oxidoreductase [Amycolatopsis jejuensis]|uniref:SDR family NAD(P)-dependent oxidoreductase n=1 Tax=Amycolatopsis jejuensis TaxID=330084 RepID=UPI000525C58E|nr:SDR family oxidoreductase [Amycolatopsis jejuensis]